VGSAELRVAFFTNTFVPDVNGVALCLATLREELQRRGSVVYVFAPAPKGPDPLADDPAVLRFPSIGVFDLDYTLAVPWWGGAARRLRGVRFDLVHTHHPLWVGGWGAWYARRARLPLVTTIHTHYELFAHLVPLPRGLVRSYLRRLVRRYCNRCDLVTTPAPSNAARLERLGVRVPVVVVPNPVDLRLFAGADGRLVRRRYGLEGKFVMGYVGRLSPEKQVPVVLEAAARVVQVRPEAHLLVVGDGPVRGELERRARELGLQGHVTFVGRVPHEQVPHYQAALDVFLSASIQETQPLAYAEAMGAGVPVILVEGLGANDMIQPGVNGFLVGRAGAAEEMARQVLWLMANPAERRRLGEGAQQWVQRYQVGAVVDRLLVAYEQARQRAAQGSERASG
jgi:1,2-diacylglycerol 3-alpha-glucosyltransferase